MQDADIYVKTDAGRDEIKSRALGLPMSIRAILLMVDGQRTVSAMRSIIAGSKAPADVLDNLLAQGLIEPRTQAAAAAAAAASAARIAPVPAALPSAPPAAAPVLGVAAPITAATAPVAPPRAVATTPPAAPPRAIKSLFDGPLDLTLPTILGPEHEPSAVPSEPEPEVLAEPFIDRYERLYAMMNEIVRDFLAPHRRYFFQLKIERCTTADELLELLHDLQTALSKSRGEAFASDVIARLRGATI